MWQRNVCKAETVSLASQREEGELTNFAAGAWGGEICFFCDIYLGAKDFHEV